MTLEAAESMIKTELEMFKSSLMKLCIARLENCLDMLGFANFQGVFVFCL